MMICVLDRGSETEHRKNIVARGDLQKHLPSAISFSGWLLSHHDQITCAAILSFPKLSHFHWYFAIAPSQAKPSVAPNLPRDNNWAKSAYHPFSEPSLKLPSKGSSLFQWKNTRFFS